MNLEKSINQKNLENEEMNSFLDWLVENILLQDDEFIEQLIAKEEE